MAIRRLPTSLPRYRRDSRAPAPQFRAFSGRSIFPKCCSASFSATSTAVDPSSEKNMCVSLRGIHLRRRSANSSAASCVKPAKITCSSFCACSRDSRGNPRIRVAMQIHPPRRNRVDNLAAVRGVQKNAFGPGHSESASGSRTRLVKGCQICSGEFIAQMRIDQSGSGIPA